MNYDSYCLVEGGIAKRGQLLQDAIVNRIVIRVREMTYELIFICCFFKDCA